MQQRFTICAQYLHGLGWVTLQPIMGLSWVGRRKKAHAHVCQYFRPVWKVRNGIFSYYLGRSTSRTIFRASKCEHWKQRRREQDTNDVKDLKNAKYLPLQWGRVVEKTVLRTGPKTNLEAIKPGYNALHTVTELHSSTTVLRGILQCYRFVGKDGFSA